MINRDAWIEPGAHVVVPGIHRIPLPLPDDGLRAVNVYVIEVDDGLCAIDGGWALEQSRTVLKRALANIGFTLSDLRSFLVTHVHRDHYTQAVALRRESGAHVSLGRGERASLEFSRSCNVRQQQIDGLIALGADELAAEVGGWSSKDADPTIWEDPDRWLGEEQIALSEGRTLEAVETPGHTAGHLVFHDVAAGLLFAGDHILSTVTPSIGFEPVRVPNPLADYLRSLAIVRARPDATLLPAHGPVAQSVHARIDELVDHHGARLDELERTAASAYLTALEAAGQIRWTRRGYAFSDLDTFNAMLATFETAAHLDLLVAQGRLVKEGIRYR